MTLTTAVLNPQAQEKGEEPKLQGRDRHKDEDKDKDLKSVLKECFRKDKD